MDRKYVSNPTDLGNQVNYESEGTNVIPVATLVSDHPENTLVAQPVFPTSLNNNNNNSSIVTPVTASLADNTNLQDQAACAGGACEIQ